MLPLFLGLFFLIYFSLSLRLSLSLSISLSLCVSVFFNLSFSFLCPPSYCNFSPSLISVTKSISFVSLLFSIFITHFSPYLFPIFLIFSSHCFSFSFFSHFLVIFFVIFFFIFYFFDIFFFSFSTDGYGLTSSASIIIKLNSPPSAGIFDVSPPIGFELTTSYNMYTSLWFDNDNDLPLLFSFGYQSPLGSSLLFPKTQKTNIFSILPSGQDSNDYQLLCQMRAYDSYDAFTSLNKSIIVNKNEVAPQTFNNLGKRKRLKNYLILFPLLSYYFPSLNSVLFHNISLCINTVYIIL